MSSSGDALEALRPLATMQEGVVSLEQAVGHGVSARVVSRMLAEGHWTRLERGVFFTSRTEPSLARAAGPGRCSEVSAHASAGWRQPGCTA